MALDTLKDAKKLRASFIPTGPFQESSKEKKRRRITINYFIFTNETSQMKFPKGLFRM
ncbi:MAG: hypothetical protein IPM96_06425 [Ignavibacteria bacterium]|nr:hypothetical protein [Ignavibacteria bacterium]